MEIELAVDRFLNALSIEQGASRNTLSSYSSDLQGFLEFTGITTTEELSGTCFADFVGFMNSSKRYAPSTIARKIASLRSFCKFLLREKILDTNPFPKRLRAKRMRLVPKSLELEEVEKLISAPDVKRPTGIRDRAILEVLYASGIRVSECAGLKISDVDFGTATIRVKGKGGKVRTSFLGDFAIEWLKRYLDEVRPKYENVLARKKRKALQAFLFLGRKGPLTRVQIYRIIRQSALKAGLRSKVSPHVLRHSFATHMLENGADIRLVQELLGHKSISTVEVYTKVTMRHLRRVYERAHPHA